MLQLLLCLLFAARSLTQSVSIGNECKTVENETGTCIDLPACDILAEPIESIRPPIPKSLAEYLRSSHCGFNGNIPKVCCPKPESVIGWNYIYHGHSHLLTDNSCGVSKEQRIFGSTEADIGEFPWMALLVYDSEKAPYMCSGSVITDRYILTGAKCITSELKRVRLGEHRISTVIDCQTYMNQKSCNPPVQEYGIEETIKHPLYKRSNISADIALIRLDRSIDFSPGYIKPVCLPLHNSLRSLNLNSKNLTVTGWGKPGSGEPSDLLLRVLVEAVDNEKCEEKYRSKDLPSYLNKKKMCAGKEGQDTCSFSAGSPLMYYGIHNDKVRYVQYGIVSYSSFICGGIIPDVYTLVPKYMKWILDNLRP